MTAIQNRLPKLCQNRGQQMNQTRGHAGEKPFGVVLSAAALMKHKANTPLFQHICICAGVHRIPQKLARTLTTLCCLTDESMKGKHICLGSGTTDVSCMMGDERN